jgi:hypothetical protein
VTADESRATESSSERSVEDEIEGVSHRLEIEMRGAGDGTTLPRLTRRGRVEIAEKSAHDID